ncbi:cytochrome-c peroxidase [Granulicella sibirica]|nr:cytochrome c peroxidase [Granulicella sibirica]
MSRITFLSAILTFSLVAVGCNGPGRERGAAVPVSAVSAATADPVALLGRSLFFDPSLSASGKLSCASCHDPGHAYAPANTLSVQRGGAEMKSAIFRAVPSLSYVLGRTPNWHQERASSFVERLEENDNPPFGGFGWDGRFKTLGEQAAFPLLSPEEMANAGASAVLEKLKGTDYAARIRKTFGDEALRDPDAAMAAVGKALERFELTDASFHPYSSKFDAVLDGKAAFSEAEARGERLFNDPARGNCASCHTSARGADGSHPLFTNFQFEALGVPRNGTLGANKDSTFYDLGLCGPLRKDQSATEAYCGMFKTPTLRNVATRGAFFHNGRFHTLREALEFYVERDTNPEKFYPRGKGGAVDRFDDLPAKYRANVDIVDLPLTKHRGETPVWSERNIDDVMAFLQTLTDGYGQ